MPAYAPATHLETHDVMNQPAPFAPRNLYATDTALREAVQREAGDWLDARMDRLGAIVGSEEVLCLGEQANRFPPEFAPFDRYGRRLDEVRFHPAYHRLMALAMEHRIHDLPWIEATAKGRHLGHMAMLALFTEAEAGTMCPINMTYASVPALRWQPDVTQSWIDRLIGGKYDAPLRPIGEKAGVTLGMAMTEKQGGSDVRANATKAYPIEGGNRLYRLVGHKWFCSAPMSDGFLTLAYAEGGLSCFLVPRILPEGGRNTLQVMRLKDKLGNKSNASAEIEYHDTEAWLLGDEGRGINVIIDMVHHTRLGTVGATLGIMRRALAEAVNHVAGRAAFQRKLIDQPLMRAVIADLALEYEAAVALAARVGAAFSADDPASAALARLSVAVAKYWLTKRNPGFVYECMECHGGVGYVEDTPMPRLFRESPVNGIWEGSGNVIALDVLRTLRREPGAVDALTAELDAAAGADRAFDAAAGALKAQLAGAPDEAAGRQIVERMALLLQAALLIRHAPPAVADAFCATRLGDGGRLFGVLPKGANVAGILARQGV
ncbi:MAG TPA: isovaleryl-CoA dehydrogenase [Amaricoccus sp.]|nr:isovaleryl-CoA dehydrogenase [Amaricoccus sp.]